jgi:uncharacterized repeat protein (TIGR01451 family)
MKWFAGALIILLIALFMESGLLAYAMYVLLALLLVSRGLARSWIGGLSATRTCDRTNAEIGDKVKITVTVRNKGRLPVPWVLLEDQLSRQATDRRYPRLKVRGKRVHIGMMSAGGEIVLDYQLECLMRGYHQIGPVVMENGDLFGLHRRFRVDAAPCFVLVYPKLVPLTGYELESRRPIGDVRMTHRLYEDPTRIAGVRGYESGDPLSRVHWRATARTGALHCKVYEPSTLSGSTILLDFHKAGYPERGEPFRSELAVTAAASLANAVYQMGQQIGMVTNARDAVERINLHGWEDAGDPRSRDEARAAGLMHETNEQLQPLRVETRRGVEQLQRIRETLARVELTDGLTCADLISEAAPRLPRDATLVAVLPDVPVETAIALGTLRRRGLAVTVVLFILGDEQLEKCYARLLAEGLRDVRHLASEEALPDLCRSQVQRSAPYDLLTTEV